MPHKNQHTRAINRYVKLICVFVIAMARKRHCSSSPPSTTMEAKERKRNYHNMGQVGMSSLNCCLAGLRCFKTAYVTPSMSYAAKNFYAMPKSKPRQSMK